MELSYGGDQIGLTGEVRAVYTRSLWSVVGVPLSVYVDPMLDVIISGIKKR